VPARIDPDADRGAGADRASTAGVLEEELRPLGVVDARVHIAAGLLDSRVAAALVGDPGAPDLGRLDWEEERVRRRQLERVEVERLDAAIAGDDQALHDLADAHAVRR